jgi:hypothetical protein
MERLRADARCAVGKQFGDGGERGRGDHAAADPCP